MMAAQLMALSDLRMVWKRLTDMTHATETASYIQMQAEEGNEIKIKQVLLKVKSIDHALSM